MIPLWAIRLAPYAGGVLLAVGAYFWAHERGYDRGVTNERAKWQAEQVEADKKAAKLAQERDDALHRADDAAARSDALLDALRLKNAQTTKVYYAENPARNLACLDTGRLQHVKESDDAARKAAAAPSASAK